MCGSVAEPMWWVGGSVLAKWLPTVLSLDSKSKLKQSVAINAFKAFIYKHPVERNKSNMLFRPMMCFCIAVLMVPGR